MGEYFTPGLGAIVLGILMCLLARPLARSRVNAWGWEPEGGGERWLADLQRGVGVLMILLGIAAILGIGL